MGHAMKGIVLAGGRGTRLYPLTTVTSKQLLPIYDKPMIYYPLSVLMDAGIRDILIISTPEDIKRFEDLLKDGSRFGIHLSYAVQKSPDGLGQAFVIAEDFIGKDAVAMVLGDNLFVGDGLTEKLKASVKRAEDEKRATIFGYKVKDPTRFGVVEFDKEGKAVSIEEKPAIPKGEHCVTGIYFYDNRVVGYAKELVPSARNEYEITDLNSRYLKENALQVEVMDDRITWMDAGTHESLYEASRFVHDYELQHKTKIACLEEIAYRNRWIEREAVEKTYEELAQNQYGAYLKELLETEI